MEGGEEEEEEGEEGGGKEVEEEREEGKLSYLTPLAPINRLLKVDYILLFSLIFNI